MTDQDLKNDHYFKDAEVCWVRDHPDCLPVTRDQGHTNCCYAFSVVNCLYSDLYINEKKSFKGSEQEFLDCLHMYKPPSCMKGKEEPIPITGYPNSFKNAFQYVKENGLGSEIQYPWVGKCVKCKKPKYNEDHHIIIKGFECIIGSHDLVVKQLREQPAVTGGILLTKSLRKWDGVGIYRYDEKETKEIESTTKETCPYGLHAITLFGFGEEDGVGYFIAQNSFGPTWGYKGYFKVLRELVTHIFYPIGTTISIKVLKRKFDCGESSTVSSDIGDHIKKIKNEISD